MRLLIAFLAKLYPWRWRQRYGTEFDTLLEDSNPDAKTALNVFSGAISMQIRTWNVGKILAAAGLAGMLIGLAVALAMPKRYESTSTVRFALSNSPITNLDKLDNIVSNIRGRASLMQIIAAHDLYPAERDRMPVMEVIDMMRRKIYIIPAGPDSLTIGFEYSDPVVAQKVTNDLTARFLDANLRNKIDANDSAISSTGSTVAQVLAIARLPQRPVFPNRTSFAILGLAAGLVLGATLAFSLRRGRPRAG